MNQNIEQKITTYINKYKISHHTETNWRQPVIGIADAADPLFLELKNHISNSHALPSDIVPGAKSVIVFFIPFEKNIVSSNIPEEESSREWDYACIETNQMIKSLCEYLYEDITKMGFRASLLPPTYNYDSEKLISDWSHRSAAYIAGIGKFGIHNMLITEKGCCGRLGSVITDMKLTVTERKNDEYCLYKKNRSCGKCMERCVNHAFSTIDGNVLFDRYKCNEQIYEKIIPKYPIGDGDACGKCMCGVPCSFQNPLKQSPV